MLKFNLLQTDSSYLDTSFVSFMLEEGIVFLLN